MKARFFAFGFFAFFGLTVWLLLWPAGAEARALAPAAVRALLNPNPSVVDARRGINAIGRQRARWEGQPLWEVLVCRQLSLFYQRVNQPDSAYRSLTRARRAAVAVARTYPVEASDAFFDLGNWHWQAQAFDSAGFYFRKAVELIERSGYDLHTRREVVLADSQTLAIGAHLASRYAHAGMAWRRLGNLGAVVRCYERTLAYYREQDHQPGYRWGLCLLGEAYEEQGNAARAAAYYEQALAEARRLPAEELVKQVGQLADVLRYYADLLLAQNRPAHLLMLTRQALGQEETLQRREHGRLFLTNIRAELRLLRAEIWLRQHQTDSAAADLAALAEQPTLTGKRGLTALPNSAEWLLTWHCLRAQVARQQHQPAAQQAALVQARQQLTLITEPSRRLRAGERLATALLAAGDNATAARVLRTLAGPTRAGGNRLKAHDLYRLLETAYVGLRRPDSAYYFARCARGLNDTLRAAQQYAALAELENRHRTLQQQQQLRQVAAQARHERQQKRLAWLSFGLLGLLLAGVGWALRLTRRLNRQNREQARRLAELDQLKTRFFTNVSHELRTPLTLVVGPVEQALQQPAELPESVRHLLDLSARNGRRLQQLVDGLLDFTKLEAGRLELHPAPVRLGLFCRQIVDAFGPLAAERQIRLELRDDLPPELTVALDGGRLEQVLTNLLSNALKFTPPGGCVWLAAEVAGPDQWRLAVHDTGPGIAPDEQARVFERFYQTRQRPAAGGTGIGLAFSRELAELMGGTLTLESRVGEGSVFTLTFPAEPILNEALVTRTEEWEGGDEDATDIPHLSVLSPHSAKVLVVEDNADLRAYLRQLLAPHYEVLEAEDGRRALDLLRRETVDLICSDEMMPHLTGSELLQHLKADPTRRRLPFLMLTARADREHRFRALELGVDDYLQKPFAPRELLARVRNLLANYRERLAFAGAAPGEAAEGPAMMMGEAPPPGDVAVAAPARVVRAETLTLADQELLERVRELAEAAIGDSDFDTPQLVAGTGVSERTLYRKLKELTGLTPAAYLREVRLDRARQLLEQRAMQTVSEVAYAVGFDNPGYFATVFLKRYGKRASEYL